MARQFDHLVHCVHDLEAAHQRFRSLGFTVRPPAVLPFGVRNRVVLLENAFIELLTVDDPGAIPPATPGNFSFGAHNQAFLAAGEGLSMLAFKGTDAPADARAFAAQGLGSYASFDFSRDAVLADGRKARAAFSLAFADRRLSRPCPAPPSSRRFWPPNVAEPRTVRRWLRRSTTSSPPSRADSDLVRV